MNNFLHNSVFHRFFHSLLKTLVENLSDLLFMKSASNFVLLTKLIYFQKRG